MRILERILPVILIGIIVFTMSVPVFAVSQTVNGSNMHEIASNNYEHIEHGITDSYGNTYNSNVLKLDASNNGYVSYDLDGNYERLIGSFVASKDTGSGAKINVAIFADGKEVYSISNYTRQQAKQSFDIDLTGVKQVDIKSSNSGEYPYGWLFIVDSQFTKSETQAIVKNWKSLRDCIVIDSSNYEPQISLKTDSFGNLHNGAMMIDASNNAYVLFNLNKQFVTLTGGFVAGDETGNGAKINVKVYCDDKEVFSKTGITKQMPLVNFTIDVSNVSVLKIETSNDGEYPYGRVYLVDDILSTHQHTPSEWVVEKEATCTEEGLQMKYCTECGEAVEFEKIVALGHKPDRKSVVIKEATCTESGEEVQYCTVCGEVAESRAVEKIPHTPGKEWEIVKEATCAEEGLRQKICTVGGEIAEEKVIEKTDHKFGSWTTLSGSVWNNPIVKERICSVCGGVEHVESNSTSWVKLLVIVLFLIVSGGLVTILVTLKINGLLFKLASIKKLFSKETLSDTDIKNFLNEKDDTEYR